MRAWRQVSPRVQWSAVFQRRSRRLPAGARRLRGQPPQGAAPQGRGAGGRGAPAQNPATFFITSVGKGDGANYGGLAGADAYCAQLAQAANLPAQPGRTWHAYLSAAAAKASPGERPRPHRHRSVAQRPRRPIAANVADLHGDVQRDRNAINKQQALNEKGQPIERRRRHAQPARHPDRLRLARARHAGEMDTTCGNYTRTRTAAAA